ncbi:hypothetical protein HanPSC8_Chr09g0363761 [Helianthus annuus]|nr:hypothetical protein HanPSC8_Chr09g0363761 [Helianthus annuus]
MSIKTHKRVVKFQIQWPRVYSEEYSCRWFFFAAQVGRSSSSTMDMHPQLCITTLNHVFADSDTQAKIG